MDVRLKELAERARKLQVARKAVDEEYFVVKKALLEEFKKRRVSVIDFGGTIFSATFVQKIKVEDKDLAWKYLQESGVTVEFTLDVKKMQKVIVDFYLRDGSVPGISFEERSVLRSQAEL